jgi:hypothetical protein
VAEQTPDSHAHHPIPTYVASLFTLIALVTATGAWLFEWATLEIAVVALACAAVTFVSMSRTYTTALQDRIILLEMKVRCAELLPPSQCQELQRLSAKQVVALRFAADDELGDLLHRAVSEQLPPAAIKRAIKRWRPDYLRT